MTIVTRLLAKDEAREKEKELWKRHIVEAENDFRKVFVHFYAFLSLYPANMLVDFITYSNPIDWSKRLYGKELKKDLMMINGVIYLSLIFGNLVYHFVQKKALGMKSYWEVLEVMRSPPEYDENETCKEIISLKKQVDGIKKRKMVAICFTGISFLIVIVVLGAQSIYAPEMFKSPYE